jgi:hypothetical protein
VFVPGFSGWRIAGDALDVFEELRVVAVLAHSSESLGTTAPAPNRRVAAREASVLCAFDADGGAN